MDYNVMTKEQYEKMFGPQCKHCGGPIDQDSGKFVCEDLCHNDEDSPVETDKT